MESLKMYSLCRCKDHTGGCGHSNYQDSFRAEQVRRWKFGEIRGYLSPWYRVCTKAMVITKGSCGFGEPKNVIALSVKKKNVLAVTGLETTRIHAAPNRADNGNLEEIQGYLSRWYRICTKAMIISKGSYGYGDRKNLIALSMEKTYWRLRAWKLPGFMQRRIGQTMEIWRKFRATYLHGSVFARKQ